MEKLLIAIFIFCASCQEIAIAQSYPSWTQTIEWLEENWNQNLHWRTNYELDEISKDNYKFSIIGTDSIRISTTSRVKKLPGKRRSKYDPNCYNIDFYVAIKDLNPDEIMAQKFVFHTENFPNDPKEAHYNVQVKSFEFGQIRIIQSCITGSVRDQSTHGYVHWGTWRTLEYAEKISKALLHLVKLYQKGEDNDASWYEKQN